MLDKRTKLIGMIKYLSSKNIGFVASNQGYHLRIIDVDSVIYFLQKRGVANIECHIKKSSVQINISPTFEFSIQSLNVTTPTNNIQTYYDFDVSKLSFEDGSILIFDRCERWLKDSHALNAESQKSVNTKVSQITKEIYDAALCEELVKLGFISKEEKGL